MLRLHRVEGAAKDELGQEQLITSADFAGDSSLDFDDIGRGGEAKAAKHALPVL